MLAMGLLLALRIDPVRLSISMYAPFWRVGYIESDVIRNGSKTKMRAQIKATTRSPPTIESAIMRNPKRLRVSEAFLFICSFAEGRRAAERTPARAPILFSSDDNLPAPR